MHKRITNKNKFRNKLTALVIMPLVFAFLAYVIIYFAGKPIIDPVMDVLSIITKDYNSSEDNNADLLDLNSLPQYSGTIKASKVAFPTYGDKYGHLTIDGTKVKTDVFFGDGSRELRLGVGQYMGSSFPGLSSTVLIGGHNNTFFNDLKSAKVGKKIRLITNYGQYVYKITKTEVRPHTDKTAYDLSATKENIVLYTCYPFNMLGLTKDRFFVYGEFVSGPKVNTKE